MPSFVDTLVSLWERLPSRRPLVAPALVTLTVIVTWSWMASSILAPALAVATAGVMGVALFGAWYAFAEALASSIRPPSENLLTQLGFQGRGNRRLAIYDSTSGLYNRWYLELRLQEEFLRCKRYGISMAVIVIRLGSLALADLSSDSWGGMASNLAHTMAQSVRAVDITAALAPLEFAICLVHCDRPGAESAIDRVLGEIAAQQADVGLAVYPEDQCDGKALIELARGRLMPTEPERLAA